MKFPYIEDSLKHFLAWFLPSLLGVATKLAYESRLKKLTKLSIITSLIMACFVGYVCDKLCTKYGLNDFRGVIVSLGALASESIVHYLFSNTPNIIIVVVKRITNIDLTINNNTDKPKEQEPPNDNTTN